MTFHELLVVGVKRYRRWIEDHIPQPWRIRIIIAIFGLGFVVASYQAWQAERVARLDAEHKAATAQVLRPELIIIDEVVKDNSDGTYTITRLVEVISPFPPNRVIFEAIGDGVINIDV